MTSTRKTTATLFSVLLLAGVVLLSINNWAAKAETSRPSYGDPFFGVIAQNPMSKSDFDLMEWGRMGSYRMPVSWESVEQWGTISGMNNRQLQIVNSPDNTMLVDDTTTDWGAEGPDDRRAVQTWRDPLVAAVEPPANSSGPATATSSCSTAASDGTASAGEFDLNRHAQLVDEVRVDHALL